MGLRENCHLGAFFFPRASLFSTFLRTLARSAGAIVRNCHFLVGRPFSCSPPGRPSMRWVGPKIASLQLLPCVPRAAGGCMSAELGGAYFLSSLCCMLVVHRANYPFPHVFPLFLTATRKCVCVCVCVCVSHTFPFISFFFRVLDFHDFPL